MGNRFKRKYMPFTYKTMIPYLVLVFLTDILVGYISYTMLIKSRTEMAETNIRTAMQQTRNNIEYQTDEIKRMTNSLFLNTTFQSALQFRGDPRENMLKMKDDIVPYMKAPLQLYGNKFGWSYTRTTIRCLRLRETTWSEPIDRSDYYVLSDRSVANKSWFTAIVEQNKDNLWLQIDTDRALGNISYFRKLFASNGAQSLIGYIRVTARFDELLGNFDTFPIDQGIALRLMDKETGTKLYERGSVAENAREGTYLIISEDIPGSDYAFETWVPNRYLNEDASKMRKVIGAVCVISFVVMAFIGLLVARLSGRR